MNESTEPPSNSYLIALAIRDREADKGTHLITAQVAELRGRLMSSDVMRLDPTHAFLLGMDTAFWHTRLYGLPEWFDKKEVFDKVKGELTSALEEADKRLEKMEYERKFIDG